MQFKGLDHGEKGAKLLTEILFLFQPPFYSRDTAEMYDNILYKPLRLRTNVSTSARSLLEGVRKYT